MCALRIERDAVGAVVPRPLGTITCTFVSNSGEAMRLDTNIVLLKELVSEDLNGAKRHTLSLFTKVARSSESSPLGTWCERFVHGGQVQSADVCDFDTAS